MSTAVAGRRREYQARDDLISKGYPAVMRAAASKGAADLLHGHPLHGAVLVQVGNGAKTLNQPGRDRFCDAAEMCNALAILATVVAVPGKATSITYWQVTRDVPSTWQEWTP